MSRKTPVPPVPEFDPGKDLTDLTDAELGFAPVEEADDEYPGAILDDGRSAGAGGVLALQGSEETGDSTKPARGIRDGSVARDNDARPSRSPLADAGRTAAGEGAGASQVRQPAVLQSDAPGVGQPAGQHGSDGGPRAPTSAASPKRGRMDSEVDMGGGSRNSSVVIDATPTGGEVRRVTGNNLEGAAGTNMETALIPIQTDNVITGLGMLARMSDEEFTAKLEMLRKGRERVATIQKTLMVEGSDYGKVKGIDRPFLFLPGAEALEKFYGLVTEQVVTRVDGAKDATGAWVTPPFGYRTDCIVHLGDLSGPVIATASGSCNVWEDRYRYRNDKPTCPQCNRPGLIKRVKPPALAGKWQCPGWADMGGCGTIYEGSDPRIKSVGKVENPDPFSLDETILQISAKRAYVAGIRRATGTSGLFSLDDDSPAVVAQSEAAGPDTRDASAPVITSAQPIGVPVAPGGRTTQVTQVQLDALKRLSVEKGLNGAKIADLLSRLFGMEVEPTGAAASAAVRSLNANQLGQLLLTIETGEVPVPTASDVEAQDPVAYATHPDDIGAK